MRPALAILPLMLALVACAGPPKKSACAGLTYTDAGVAREQYGPCARAMVAELDRMHEALAIIGDAARSKDERLRAKTDCFNANVNLTRLIGEAGGVDKLVYVRWADPELSRLNYDLAAARTAYVSDCYYALPRPEVAQIDPSHAEARDVAQTLP